MMTQDTTMPSKRLRGRRPFAMNPLSSIALLVLAFSATSSALSQRNHPDPASAPSSMETSQQRKALGQDSSALDSPNDVRPTTESLDDTENSQQQEATQDSWIMRVVPWLILFGVFLVLNTIGFPILCKIWQENNWNPEKRIKTVYLFVGMFTGVAIGQFGFQANTTSYVILAVVAIGNLVRNVNVLGERKDPIAKAFIMCPPMFFFGAAVGWYIVMSNQPPVEESPEKPEAEVARRLDQSSQQTDGQAQQLKEEVAVAERIEPSEQSSYGSRNAQAETLETLAHAVGNLTLYRDELNKFSASYPQSSFGVDFQRVLSEDLPLVDRLTEWHAMLDDWAALDLSRLDAEEARTLSDKAESLLPDFRQFPQGDAVRARLAVIAAISKRLTVQGESIVTQLVDSFTAPAFSVPFVLQTKQGKRYYLAKAPTPESTYYSFEYVTNFNLEQRAAIVAQADMDLTASGRVAHAKYAKAAQTRLSSMGQTDWESTFSRMVRAIHKEPRIDDIVKVRWITELLSVGCQGSESLRVVFAEHLGQLQAADVKQEVNWLDADDAGVEATRARCKHVLEQLPDLERASVEADGLFRDLGILRGYCRHQWIGFLYRNEKGDWDGSIAKVASAKSGRVTLIRRTGPGGSLTMHQVGHWTTGALKLDNAEAAAFVAGRPLFVEVEQPKE